MDCCVKPGNDSAEVDDGSLAIFSLQALRAAY
jgi:hypothetical protein